VGSCGGEVGNPGFLEGLKARAEDGPLGCGKNDSSGFVVSCGGLWLISGYFGIPSRFPGFFFRWRRRIVEFLRCKKVVETWSVVSFLWKFGGSKNVVVEKRRV
jgi:hypothetical protein